jgi:uncharacterized integral membrane protein
MDESRREPTPEPERSENPDERMDREHMRQLQRARRARVAKAVVISLIVVLLIVFVIQNSDPVPVVFLFLDGEPRLIWVLVVTIVLGAIVGYLLGRPGKDTRLHRRDENHQD